MKFAFAVLLAAGLAMVALQADGQTMQQSSAASLGSRALHLQPVLIAAAQWQMSPPVQSGAPQQPSPSPQAQAPTTPQRPVQSPQAQTPATAQPSTATATTRPASPTPASPTSKKRVHGKTAVAEAAPALPPPPPTLEQTAPTAPNVTLRNGELTIDAPNSTLAQVLHAVQGLTGASVDMPGGAANDRVVTHLGPGQPSDVLKTLLNGSKFDYVILGVNGDPGGVQKIILTPRQAGGTTTAQNQPTPQPPQEQDESPIAENEENPEPPPPPPAGGFRRPGMPNQPIGQPSNNNNGDTQNSFAGPGGEAQQQNGAKTPEQLMQELQQMQEQQQQYQQQLNPANRTPQQ